MSHIEFMRRCLQLARKGEGFTRPNPMVGAVVVHNNKIIGEGFHRRYGETHAEVNAIANIKDQALLATSTLYVSLEPCSHHGRTPPCVEHIITKKIPRVVVATLDPNPKVSGKGIKMMREKGIEVTVGILESEAQELNRFFFTNHLYSRPYIILKWAQSSDGFMDRDRSSRKEEPVKISNNLTNSIVHMLRTKVQGIMVGTSTAILDNPKLTARNWFGEHPTRVVIDRENKIPVDSNLFDSSAPTIVFTKRALLNRDNKWIKQIEIEFTKETEQQMLNSLYEEKIYSLLIEGGKRLLSSFIDKHMWDEAFVEISDKTLFSGIKAPYIGGHMVANKKLLGSTQLHLRNKANK